jgi:RNA-directed DNA polymerase
MDPIFEEEVPRARLALLLQHFSQLKAKSAVARPSVRKFLGFSFTGGRQPRRRIAPQAIARLKAKVRELTRRMGGQSLSQVAKELAKT